METSSQSDNSIRTLMHDLNGQLFVVRGMTELLEMEMPEDSPARKRIAKILEACEKISAISTSVSTRARERNL
ncbi:MAG: hypothetical protein LBV12_07965 [Puniceicoccales bacterium]|nr:hypothetical protein [Puniceicoccales bacterium]